MQPCNHVTFCKINFHIYKKIRNFVSSKSPRNPARNARVIHGNFMGNDSKYAIVKLEVN